MFFDGDAATRRPPVSLIGPIVLLRGSSSPVSRVRHRMLTVRSRVTRLLLTIMWIHREEGVRSCAGSCESLASPTQGSRLQSGGCSGPVGTRKGFRLDILAFREIKSLCTKYTVLQSCSPVCKRVQPSKSSYLTLLAKPYSKFVAGEAEVAATSTRYLMHMHLSFKWVDAQVGRCTWRPTSSA